MFSVLHFSVDPWRYAAALDVTPFLTDVTAYGSVVSKYFFLTNRATIGVFARTRARMWFDIPAGGKSIYVEACIGVHIEWYASGEVSSSTWLRTIRLVLMRFNLQTLQKHCRPGLVG